MFCQFALTDSVYDIVQYFFARGIAFSRHVAKAIYPANNARAGADFNGFNSLGLRSKQHTFTSADYTAYEDKHNALLRSSRGRAAFLRGGIVWCLAMEFSQSPVNVLFGPTDSVTEDGHSFNDTDYMYWDDSLKSKELDLICGVYQVYTCTGLYFLSVDDRH